MKSTLSLSPLLLLLPGLTSAQSCQVQTNIRYTFYGWPDNDPPGPGTAIACGGRGFKAGGTGTFADPLTFATARGQYKDCEIVYSPYLKKYLRMEDTCAQCTSDWNQGILHIDIWTGSNTSGGGQTQINCENSLTPGQGQAVVRNPPNNLAVDTTALFSNGVCKTSATFPGAAGSCSGSGSGGGGGGPTDPGTTDPGTCQTGCSWAGHCIGCACQTENDCSDDFVCKSGKCAKP